MSSNKYHLNVLGMLQSWIEPSGTFRSQTGFVRLYPRKHKKKSPVTGALILRNLRRINSRISFILLFYGSAYN